MTRDIYAELSHHRVFLESLKKELDSVNVKVNEFFRQIQFLCQKPDIPAEYINFKSLLETRTEKVESLQKENQEVIKAFRLSLEKFRNDLLEIKTRTESIESNIALKESTVNINFREAAEDLQIIQDMVENQILNHKEFVKNQISNFFSSVEASPASILDSNKQIAKSLQETMKGLHNAMQRIEHVGALISNVERQIKGFDDRLKKLEGI